MSFLDYLWTGSKPTFGSLTEDFLKVPVSTESVSSFVTSYLDLKPNQTKLASLEQILKDTLDLPALDSKIYEEMFCAFLRDEPKPEHLRCLASLASHLMNNQKINIHDRIYGAQIILYAAHDKDFAPVAIDYLFEVARNGSRDNDVANYLSMGLLAMSELVTQEQRRELVELLKQEEAIGIYFHICIKQLPNIGWRDEQESTEQITALREISKAIGHTSSLVFAVNLISSSPNVNPRNLSSRYTSLLFAIAEDTTEQPGARSSAVYVLEKIKELSPDESAKLFVILDKILNDESQSIDDRIHAFKTIFGCLNIDSSQAASCVRTMENLYRAPETQHAVSISFDLFYSSPTFSREKAEALADLYRTMEHKFGVKYLVEAYHLPPSTEPEVMASSREFLTTRMQGAA